MPTVLQDKIERHITDVVLARLAEEPVVVLHGARTVGKSTLVQDVARDLGVEVIDLDDLDARAAVDADPAFFVAGPSPIVIDEYQRVGALLDAIKAELNRDLRAGRYLLTGSTRYASSPRIAQSLAGRVHVLTIWPLSQGELAGVRETFLDQLLEDSNALVSPTRASTTRDEYARRMLAGGYPLALARSDDRSRSRWFRDYVGLVVEKDVLEISKVRQREHLPRFLERLASQTAQVLNVSEAARVVGIDPDAASSYLRLLEAVFLVHRLPAWGRTLARRVAGSPKIHIADSGLASNLLGITVERLESKDPAILTEFGHVAETFGVNEILKQASWRDDHVRFGHFRTHEHVEVDLVVEVEDHRVAAVEFKAAGSVRSRDAAGLEYLRGRLGSRFAGGAVVYLGQRSYALSDRVCVVPLERLWM